MLVAKVRLLSRTWVVVSLLVFAGWGKETSLQRQHEDVKFGFVEPTSPASEEHLRSEEAFVVVRPQRQ